MFQANTNGSLKKSETQVGQLNLNMQNQSRDSFSSDTKKNPKDCMAITLKSGVISFFFFLWCHRLGVL